MELIKAIRVVAEWHNQSEPDLSDPPTNVEMSEWTRWSNQATAIAQLGEKAVREAKRG